jgi:hypothetical protein
MDLTFINNKFLYKQVNPLLHVGFPAFFNKKQNHLDLKIYNCLLPVVNIKRIKFHFNINSNVL